MRTLVQKLENVENLALAHPYVDGIEKIYYCNNDDDVKQLKLGDLDIAVSPEVNGTAIPVYTTVFYIGLSIESRQAGGGKRQLDITWPTTEFVKMVKAWDKFDDATMGVAVSHIKNTSLPENCFREGEARPVRQSKRSKSIKVRSTFNTDSVLTFSLKQTYPTRSNAPTALQSHLDPIRLCHQMMAPLIPPQ